MENVEFVLPSKTFPAYLENAGHGFPHFAHMLRDVLRCNVPVGDASAPISEDNGSYANLIADESLEYIVNACLEGKWKMETRKEVR
jgi:hypothetical protein